MVKLCWQQLWQIDLGEGACVQTFEHSGDINSLGYRLFKDK